MAGWVGWTAAACGPRRKLIPFVTGWTAATRDRLWESMITSAWLKLRRPGTSLWSRQWSVDCRDARLTLSPWMPLRLYTLPYWSNPLFLFFWRLCDVTSFIATVDDTLTWGGGRAVERDSETWLAEKVNCHCQLICTIKSIVIFLFMCGFGHIWTVCEGHTQFSAAPSTCPSHTSAALTSPTHAVV